MAYSFGPTLDKNPRERERERENERGKNTTTSPTPFVTHCRPTSCPFIWGLHLNWVQLHTIFFVGTGPSYLSIICQTLSIVPGCRSLRSAARAEICLFRVPQRRPRTVTPDRHGKIWLRSRDRLHHFPTYAVRTMVLCGFTTAENRKKPQI